jgi:hypothetical protein
MNPLVIATVVFGIFFVGSLLMILARKPEKSALWTGFGIALTFVIGLLFVLLVPSFNSNWSPNTATDAVHYHNVYNVADFKGPDDNSAKPLTSLAGIPLESLAGYTPLQQHGRLVYQREGCMYCHSQQIRPLDGEMKRYSIGTSLAVPADAQEYIWDQPHFLGTRRIGPDLSRVGGKYSDDWHYSHFYYPRQMVPGSVMPQFTWLFDKDADGNPVPNADARALVAYVQTLGYGRQVPDGKGGWRSWLKTSDQQVSQNIGVSAVIRARKPVLGGDQPSSTNRVTTPPVGHKPAPATGVPAPAFNQ